jgi:lysophospholipase L1-like esterase
LLLSTLALIGCRPTQVTPYAADFSGRVDRNDGGGPRMAWSGTSFSLRFSGSEISFAVRDLPKTADEEGQTYPNRLRVALDDQVEEIYLPQLGELHWKSPALKRGEHRLHVFKQTEAMVGEVQLLGLQVRGRVLPPAPRLTRRLEIIGDSFTAGYGNEGADEKCPFSAQTENHWESYGQRAARAVGAELVVTAWSGRGVMRNHSAKAPLEVMPQLWERTLPARAESKWDFSRFLPDAVVINLGANDFVGGDPGREFADAYWALLEKVRSRYPQAHLLCATFTQEGGLVAAVDEAVKQRVEQGDGKISRLVFPPRQPEHNRGCNWHPGLATHAVHGEVLAQALREKLGWGATP